MTFDIARQFEVQVSSDLVGLTDGSFLALGAWMRDAARFSISFSVESS